MSASTTPRVAYSEVSPTSARQRGAFLERAVALFARQGVTRRAGHDRQRLGLPEPSLARPAAGSRCGTSAHGRTRRAPTARPSASSRPACANGPTPPLPELAERAAALRPWLDHYNTTRPHAAFPYQPPASRLCRPAFLGSTRPHRSSVPTCHHRRPARRGGARSAAGDRRPPARRRRAGPPGRSRSNRAWPPRPGQRDSGCAHPPRPGADGPARSHRRHRARDRGDAAARLVRRPRRAGSSPAARRSTRQCSPWPWRSAPSVSYRWPRRACALTARRSSAPEAVLRDAPSIGANARGPPGDRLTDAEPGHGSAATWTMPRSKLASISIARLTLAALKAALFVLVDLLRAACTTPIKKAQYAFEIYRRGPPRPADEQKQPGSPRRGGPSTTASRRQLRCAGRPVDRRAMLLG